MIPMPDWPLQMMLVPARTRFSGRYFDLLMQSGAQRQIYEQPDIQLHLGIQLIAAYLT
jgi:hypothetical protein